MRVCWVRPPSSHWFWLTESPTDGCALERLRAVERRGVWPCFVGILQCFMPWNGTICPSTGWTPIGWGFCQSKPVRGGGSDPADPHQLPMILTKWGKHIGLDMFGSWTFRTQQVSNPTSHNLPYWLRETFEKSLLTVSKVPWARLKVRKTTGAESVHVVLMDIRPAVKKKTWWDLTQISMDLFKGKSTGNHVMFSYHQIWVFLQIFPSSNSMKILEWWCWFVFHTMSIVSHSDCSDNMRQTNIRKEILQSAKHVHQI